MTKNYTLFFINSVQIRSWS